MNLTTLPLISVLVVAGVALVIVAVTQGIVQSQNTAGQYDTDGDGLIEISNLEQLDSMRYDLDGDGRPAEAGAEAYAAAFPGAEPGMGCPRNRCSGYELIQWPVTGL